MRPASYPNCQKQYFGLSEQVYSYFFAANSFFAVVGPFLYMKLIGIVSPRQFTYGCFIFTVVSAEMRR